MNAEPDNRELDKRIELLRKDYEIMKTDINGTLKEIQADAAKREIRLILTMVGLVLAASLSWTEQVLFELICDTSKSILYSAMNETVENRELEHRVDILGERMNTHEARIDSTLNALRTDMERFNTEAAKRSDAQTKWMIGIVVAAVVIIIGAVSLLTPI